MLSRTRNEVAKHRRSGRSSPGMMAESQSTVCHESPLSCHPQQPTRRRRDLPAWFVPSSSRILAVGWAVTEAFRAATNAGPLRFRAREVKRSMYSSGYPSGPRPVRERSVCPFSLRYSICSTVRGHFSGRMFSRLPGLGPWPHSAPHSLLLLLIGAAPWRVGRLDAARRGISPALCSAAVLSQRCQPVSEAARAVRPSCGPAISSAIRASWDFPGLSPRPARRGSVPPFSSGVMGYDCSCGPIQCGPCAGLPPRRRARREHPPLAVIDHSAADRETGPWRSERLILSSRHFHSLGHVLSLRWHVDPYRLSPSAPDLLVTCVLLVVSWSRRGGGATLAGDPRDLPFAALGIGKGRAEVPGKTTCAGQLALRFSGVPPNRQALQRRRADKWPIV